jgi:hypothetical protein
MPAPPTICVSVVLLSIGRLALRTEVDVALLDT